MKPNESQTYRFTSFATGVDQQIVIRGNLDVIGSVWGYERLNVFMIIVYSHLEVPTEGSEFLVRRHLENVRPPSI